MLIYQVNPTSDTMLGSIGGSSNTKNSVNAVFIPTVDHKGFNTTQQQDPASADVVSLREGLGIRDGPTPLKLSDTEEKRKLFL